MMPHEVLFIWQDGKPALPVLLSQHSDQEGWLSSLSHAYDNTQKNHVFILHVYHAVYAWVQKKLIVSRQPIFTNLKSNTMKNIAKIRLKHISCKHMCVKLCDINTISCKSISFANYTFTIPLYHTRANASNSWPFLQYTLSDAVYMGCRDRLHLLEKAF